MMEVVPGVVWTVLLSDLRQRCRRLDGKSVTVTVLSPHTKRDSFYNTIVKLSVLLDPQSPTEGDCDRPLQTTVLSHSYSKKEGSPDVFDDRSTVCSTSRESYRRSSSK